MCSSRIRCKISEYVYKYILANSNFSPFLRCFHTGSRNRDRSTKNQQRRVFMRHVHKQCRNFPTKFESFILIEFNNHDIYTGLELARVPRVPGTRQNYEHQLWHPQILRFLILTGTRRTHYM